MNQQETLALWKQGKESWNSWALKMLAERQQLEDTGKWYLEEAEAGHRVGGNQFTREWLGRARAIFSTSSNPLHSAHNPDFISVEFPGDVIFDNAQFNGAVNFSHANIHGSASFRNAIFTGESTFSDVTFSGNGLFENAAFNENTRFEGAIFRRNAIFRKTKFRCYAASFKSCHFKWSANFDESTFQNNAFFGNAVFEGTAIFNAASIGGLSSFRSAEFFSSSTFHETKFHGPSGFGLCQFHKHAFFSHADFCGTATFRLSSFHADVHFESTTFSKPANFSETFFGESTSFYSAQVHQSLDLTKSEFLYVPDFRQMHCSEAPLFDEIIIKHGKYKKIKKPPFESTASQLSISAKYRALKRLAIQGHDHKHEVEFFAEELRSKRLMIYKPTDPNWWLSHCFENLSNYGQSIVVPLLWWLLTVAVSALMYIATTTPLDALRSNRCVEGAGSQINSAYQLAFSKGLLIPSLSDRTIITQAYNCLYGDIVPGIVSVISGIQSLASTILIFLFILGLRNRFKLK
ncbi:pentapeptide repeat-containing protein [Thalassospira sp.]|uniref:pentapeptide repeat-containing protein n=1 Tax=Thalassospira sp. TaxID=1912094 RepID=UPI001B1C4952|nr:pentapeptide repeat-containing protein [Thalassospira sp.]MBO6807459.1 pentapeptide repeat-containing protein [Thalassospira sp.]MBO6839984.1 pentapeptide repeat-containing protein [Thalassospira sp.]